MAEAASGERPDPGVVVINWTPAHMGLIDALARTMARAGVRRITCIGEELETQTLPHASSELELCTVALAPRLHFDELVDRLVDELQIVEARAVIVLPRMDAAEPDSLSRLTCAAIRKACGERSGPNILVEVEDPEAAFEFVGLGVATVFYSGHLRAALLGQACVDLGVFQFVLGLLQGRHRIRTIPVPEHLRAKTFADAAVELEVDEHDRPMTVIGVARPTSELGEGGVIANPGPDTPLRGVLGLVALVRGEDA